MPDRLSELNLCEEGWEQATLKPETVVFSGVWGEDSYASKIMPAMYEAGVMAMDVGLRDQGIAVTFASKEDASLVRLFFKGDTLIG